MPSFDSEEYVKWAIRMLETGEESESLIILAGLDREAKYIKLKYFEKALSELKINPEINKDQALKAYAMVIAESVLEKRMSPLVGLKKIVEIHIVSDCKPEYVGFMIIEEDIDLINSGLSSHVNSKVTKDNILEFIKREFQILIDTLLINGYEDINEWVFCNKCRELSYPETKSRMKIGFTLFEDKSVCGNCGSKNISSFYSQEGRRKIINRIKKHS